MICILSIQMLFLKTYSLFKHIIAVKFKVGGGGGFGLPANGQKFEHDLVSQPVKMQYCHVLTNKSPRAYLYSTRD